MELRNVDSVIAPLRDGHEVISLHAPPRRTDHGDRLAATRPPLNDDTAHPVGGIIEIAVRVGNRYGPRALDCAEGPTAVALMDAESRRGALPSKCRNAVESALGTFRGESAHRLA